MTCIENIKSKPGGVPSPRIVYLSKKTAFSSSLKNSLVRGIKRSKATLDNESNPRTSKFN